MYGVYQVENTFEELLANADSLQQAEALRKKFWQEWPGMRVVIRVIG